MVEAPGYYHNLDELRRKLKHLYNGNFSDCLLNRDVSMKSFSRFAKS